MINSDEKRVNYDLSMDIHGSSLGTIEGERRMQAQIEVLSNIVASLELLIGKEIIFDREQQQFDLGIPEILQGARDRRDNGVEPNSDTSFERRRGY